MLHFKTKNISLPLLLCVALGVLSPSLSWGDEVNSWGGDSGSIDAGKAAAQRAAIAKRAAKKQKRAEEKKAAEEAKQNTETPKEGEAATK